MREIEKEYSIAGNNLQIIMKGQDEQHDRPKLRIQVIFRVPDAEEWESYFGCRTRMDEAQRQEFTENGYRYVAEGNRLAERLSVSANGVAR